MDILKINGVAIKAPSTLEYQRYAIDSEDGSGRNQDGEMVRDCIGVKTKLVCTFPPMRDDEISDLLKAVEPLFFEIEYPDAYIGGRRTMTAYVGDRTMPLYIYDKITNSWIWQGLSMNFIEK